MAAAAASAAAAPMAAVNPTGRRLPSRFQCQTRRAMQCRQGCRLAAAFRRLLPAGLQKHARCLQISYRSQVVHDSWQCTLMIVNAAVTFIWTACLAPQEQMSNATMHDRRLMLHRGLCLRAEGLTHIHNGECIHKASAASWTRHIYLRAGVPSDAVPRGLALHPRWLQPLLPHPGGCSAAPLRPQGPPAASAAPTNCSITGVVSVTGVCMPISGLHPCQWSVLETTTLQLHTGLAAVRDRAC